MFLFAEGGGHHTPLIVDFVNTYLGKPVYEFQINYTKPLWDNLVFSHFGTNAEAVFGPYTPENAIPWYTVMFAISCLLTVALVHIFKGKLSEDDPMPGQLTLEAGYLAVRDLVSNVIGPHGLKYFPVIATFATLILVSNLMGLFPLFMSPTAHISVTIALGITSFVYYNYLGISENGIKAHLGHLMGPIWWIAPLIFAIELFSNLIRPVTLGIRLFANMFADEQIAMNIAGLYPPFTQYLVPVILLPLAVFVALVQTLVFTLLSAIYIGEVTHPHDEHHGDHGDAHAHA
ncbi:MAG: F0F1 ATP synthase subunit A [Acidobacteriota bacterium]|jgi:F-type H+-transporting ATPase subunit a